MFLEKLTLCNNCHSQEKETDNYVSLEKTQILHKFISDNLFNIMINSCHCFSSIFDLILNSYLKVFTNGYYIYQTYV